MLRAILNKFWRQDPTKQQLYGHLPPITKTIQVRWTRYAGYCWRSRDELISDVLLWTPSHSWAKAGRPARTYIMQLCEDTGCSPEDLPEAMNDREERRERVRDIRADGATRWDDDFRRTKKLLETKLCSRNLFKEINISVIPLIRYSEQSWSGQDKNLSKLTKEQENLSPCIRHYIPEMTLTDNMHQERRKEEDLPTLKTALTHRYIDSKTT